MRTYTVLYTSLACWWSCSDFSCIAEYSHRSDHHDTPWHQIVRFAMAMCTHYSLYCKLLSRLIKYYYLHYVNNLRTEFNIQEQKTLLRFKCSIFGYFWEIRPEKGFGQRRDPAREGIRSTSSPSPKVDLWLYIYGFFTQGRELLVHCFQRIKNKATKMPVKRQNNTW